jgi:hypothetical protein
MTKAKRVSLVKAYALVIALSSKAAARNMLRTQALCPDSVDDVVDLEDVDGIINDAEVYMTRMQNVVLRKMQMPAFASLIGVHNGYQEVH